MSRSDLDYLKHIVDEGRYLIDASATLNRESFLIDETAKRAFARSIEVIGEASKKLSVDFREEHSEMDWRAMAGMRDVLIHAYFGVDDEIVWDVASKEIPGLVSRLANLINELESGSRE